MRGNYRCKPHLRGLRSFLFFAVALCLGIAAQMRDATRATDVTGRQSSSDGWLSAAAGADVAGEGKELYANHCQSCHGESGKGDGPAAHGLSRPPGSFADPLLAKKSDQVLFEQISTGKMPMPSFAKTLSEQERWLLVRYIRTFAGSK